MLAVGLIWSTLLCIKGDGIFFDCSQCNTHLESVHKIIYFIFKWRPFSIKLRLPAPSKTASSSSGGIYSSLFGAILDLLKVSIVDAWPT